ncbi:MAG TPA: tetratricopeptide repeat protein [Candidatus Saccharimonadales bacterium]|jgi:predicted Zn-dependent protease/TolB-like protein|nr:tetratricopeptide repeat protein [Candidatus Saccharimonadales bacterium]
MSQYRFICRALLVSCAPLCVAASLAAQQTSAPSNGSTQAGVYLVFPFENARASPRLDWLSEGLEELTIQALSAGGQQVYSHAGRTTELERDGLPFSAKLSRASMLRVAQDVDADFVIFGSFTSDGKTLTVDSRVLRIDPLALLPSVRESGPLESLIEMQSKVVWRLLAENDKAYRPTLAEFSKAQRPLRLDAFEHYIRGLLANEDEARLRELREASRLEPAWPDPYFALGETYFSRNDCANALAFLTHVPSIHSRYVEALFSTGVCRLQLNQPDRAEEIFISLQHSLTGGVDANNEAQTGVSGADLPEVLNNLAIARARLGQTAEAQADLRRATDLDPDEDDYPFNLGLLAMQSGNFAAATAAFRDASERKPENPEDRSLLVQSLERDGKKAEADQERESAAESLGPNALQSVHLEAKPDATFRLARIRTELDTTALRLEIAASSKGANSALGVSADSAAAHIRHGRQEFTAGRLDSAENEFRGVLHAEPANAAAHRGLGEISHRRGKLDDAVKELQASLDTRDSALVRTMLARIYLEQKKPDLARSEVQRALKLAPNYPEAKQLLEHLQNSKPSGDKQ